MSKAEHVIAVRIVLIDTWWNVNYCLNNNHDQSSIVLIDTWWNVNLEPALKMM